MTTDQKGYNYLIYAEGSAWMIVYIIEKVTPELLQYIACMCMVGLELHVPMKAFFFKKEAKGTVDEIV